MNTTRLSSLVLAAAWAGLGMLLLPGCSPQGPEHGTAYLLKVEPEPGSVGQSEDAAMAKVESALRQRLESFGYQVRMERPKDLPRLIRLTTSAGGEDLPSLRRLVTQGGLLRCNWVHQESQKLLEKKEMPAGYEVRREVRRTPQGQESVIRHLVSTQAIAGLSSANLKKAAVAREPSTQVVSLTLEFNEAGGAAFATATAENVGRVLAVLIDNDLVSAPVIRSKIEGGRAVISGQWKEREALTTTALLTHPISAHITLVEERSF